MTYGVSLLVKEPAPEKFWVGFPLAISTNLGMFRHLRRILGYIDWSWAWLI
jgi:hypothetical protein